MRSGFLALVLLAACATTPADVSPAPVVAAERAFAADAAARGWIPAFRAFTASDGIVLQPDPVNSHDTFAAIEDDGNKALAWWPAYAGIARSGDLGFTTGPFRFGDGPIRGHYFTVWRKQDDGAWRWIFDGGVDVRDASPIAQGAEPATLPVAASGAGLEGKALREIVAIETAFATRAARDLADPYGEYLADEARLNRNGAAPAIGREAALASATGYSATATFSKLGGAASHAGDLVFSYGEASWTKEGAAQRGHYARIWQRRPEGWRIVFDQIIPRRE